MSRTVIFLGGLGHCTERLTPAQTVLKGMGSSAFNLIDVPYPGFEGRPMTSDWQGFLTDIAQHISGVVSSNDSVILYGTGIGAFVAFSLRAHGRFTNIPAILQGPVIWGIQKRPLPRFVRAVPPLRDGLPNVFAIPALASQFEARYFRAPIPPSIRKAFFGGFAQCRALPALAAWLTPELLLETERRCEAQPEALNDIAVWQGAHDRLASHEEVQWAEEALGVTWPLTTFETWDHYPMIDAPEEWVNALNAAFDQMLPESSPPPQ